MRRSLLWGLAAALGAGTLLFATASSAQEYTSPSTTSTQEYAAVVRLAVASGSVSIRQAGSSQTVPGAVNAPLTDGDYVLTGDASRAEIQIDDANFIRASEDVQLRLSRVEQTEHEVQLAAGTIELSVLKVTGGLTSVQTPSITIMPADAGIYRITVTKDGTTLLTVRSGKAELLVAGGAQTIEAGKSVEISGTAGNPSITPIQTIGYDDFDAWNTDRDKVAWQAYAMSDYASPQITGIADLSNYGNWSYAPQVGYVWSPYNQSNWSPYSNGRWAWAQPIGWTWVGFEPWGWAPYHYGRWFYAPAFGWAWYPGPLYAQYFWQPCLVAFFGFGLGGGFNFGMGNLGWVPLGPFDPFYPLFPFKTFSPAPVHGTLPWSNARWPGGITAIKGNSLTSWGSYQYVHVSPNDLHDVVAVHGALPIAPTAADLRYAQDGNVAVRSIALSPRFAQMPAPKAVQTFEQQRELVASHVNEALHQATLPERHVVAPSAQHQAPPIHQNAPTSHQSNAQSAQSPWSRFEGQQFEIKPQPVKLPASQINAPARPQAAPAPSADPWSRFINGDQSTSSAHAPTFLSTMPGTVHSMPLQGAWPAFHSGTGPILWNGHAPAAPPGFQMPVAPPPQPAPASGGHGNH